jgi:hypothetical protein
MYQNLPKNKRFFSVLCPIKKAVFCCMVKKQTLKSIFCKKVNKKDRQSGLGKK